MDQGSSETEWHILECIWRHLNLDQAGCTDRTFYVLEGTSHLQESITPVLDKLVCVRLTPCMASDWCKCGFFTMNLIKNRIHNSLTTSFHDDLTMAHLNGPKLFIAPIHPTRR